MSFRLKTILGIALIETVLLFVLVISGLSFLKDSNETQLQQRAEITSRLFANATKDALLATDLATLESFIEEILSNPDIVYTRISNSSGIVLAEGGDKQILNQPRKVDRTLADVHDHIFDVRSEITEGGITFGIIEMGLATSSIEKTLSEAKQWTITIAALEVVLVAIFSFVLGTYLTRQLQHLKQASETIGRSGPGHQIMVLGRDEIADVAHTFNQMSSKLKTTYEALQKSLAKQKAMLAVANQKEAQNKAILSASLDAIITIDASGNIVGYNKAAVRTFGWKQGEISNQSIDNLIPSNLNHAHNYILQQFLETGSNAPLGQRQKSIGRNKNGREFPIEITISPIQTDEGLMFTSFIRDISLQEKNEMEIRLAAHAFETSEAVFITDTNGTIIRANTAVSRITGYRHEELVGQNPRLFSSGQQDESFYKLLWKQLTENGQWSGEVYNRRKDGETFPEYLNITAVKDSDGETSHYVAHIFDLSEQKHNEAQLREATKQAEAASVAKSRFLAAMSHEIRTPMNAVLGILGLLRDTSLTKQQLELVTTGRDSGELLLSIINDILDFSKMEAGKLELEKMGFDLHRLLNNTRQMMKHLAARKKLTLELIIDPTLPHCAKGDPERLRQILINLINNAIKFTSQGYVKISVSAVPFDEDCFMLHCAVEDNGIGIPQAQLANLFNEFTMVDQSHSRSHEGTGLGLAICRRLVTMMHGEIQVESQQGLGSTFSFSAKLESAEANECIIEPLEEQTRLIPASHVRILLAEDNPANQRVIKSILEYAGLQVDIVANGREALEAVDSLPYDIVLMDVSMPEMDGMEATQNIRKLAGPQAKIPIIALTAHALSGDRARFLDAGMDDYLTKPIDRAATLHCIARWTEAAKNPATETTPTEQAESPQADNNHADTTQELVDEAVLQQLVRDTSAEILPEILLAYIEDAKKLVNAIQQALDENDMKKLEFNTHTLGSSAGAHGNSELLKLARAVENHCREAETTIATELANTLPAIAERSFKMLAKRVAQGF